MARVYLLWLCVFGLAYVAPCASCPSIGLVVRGRIGLVATQHSIGLVPAACASRVGACCALEWCRPQHLAGGDDATDLSCEEHGTQS